MAKAEKIRRYFYGWYHFIRAFRMARAKRHGAGKMPIINALKMGSCARHIIDGQHVGRRVWWLK